MVKMSALTFPPIALALALATSPAAAQSQTGDPSVAPVRSGAGTPAGANAYLASDLIGMSVHDADGGRLGEISDMTLARDGRVGAVVISVGGFLGVGERHVAVPFGEIAWIEDARAAVASGSTGSGTTTGPRGADVIGAKEALRNDTDRGGVAQPNRDVVAGTGDRNPDSTRRATAARAQNTGSDDNPGEARPAPTARTLAPYRAVLNVTRSDLESAPMFRQTR